MKLHVVQGVVESLAASWKSFLREHPRLVGKHSDIFESVWETMLRIEAVGPSRSVHNCKGGRQQQLRVGAAAKDSTWIAIVGPVEH